MAKWKDFPYNATAYTHDVAALKKHWARLHQGDAEPLPKDEAVLAAWALFHAGRFHEAHDAGLKAGGAGVTVANKAQSIYANYLETSEKTRLAMFLEVAERAEAQAKSDPQAANAHYWAAYALGRYSQGISVAKALEPESASVTLARGAWHVLSLLTPYLEPASREHLHTLAGAYQS